MEKAWEEARKRLYDWPEKNSKTLKRLNMQIEQIHIPEKCPYAYEETMTRDLRKES